MSRMWSSLGQSFTIGPRESQSVTLIYGDRSLSDHICRAEQESVCSMSDQGGGRNRLHTSWSALPTEGQGRRQEDAR